MCLPEGGSGSCPRGSRSRIQQVRFYERMVFRSTNHIHHFVLHISHSNQLAQLACRCCGTGTINALTAPKSRTRTVRPGSLPSPGPHPFGSDPLSPAGGRRHRPLGSDPKRTGGRCHRGGHGSREPVGSAWLVPTTTPG